MTYHVGSQIEGSTPLSTFPRKIRIRDGNTSTEKHVKV